MRDLPYHTAVKVSGTAAMLTTLLAGIGDPVELPGEYPRPEPASYTLSMVENSFGIKDAPSSPTVPAIDFAVMSVLFESYEQPLPAEVQEYMSRHLAAYLD